MLHSPPFKLSLAATAYPGAAVEAQFVSDACCSEEERAEIAPAHGRARLGDLNNHLHCSLLGTCMSTTELRKLMARFIDVHAASDLDVHHEAVRLTAEDSAVSKMLSKALDKRHDAVVQRFSRTRDAAALGVLWDDALRQGEVPGAYWAVLTHRSVTPELRQRAFGDVHMLSHLVGAANRADIRRLVALENENADLQDRLERQHARSQQLLDDRDAALIKLQHQSTAQTAHQTRIDAPSAPDAAAEALNAMVVAQTLRRERAEVEASVVSAEAQRLQRELDQVREHARLLALELAAAEVQLREQAEKETEGATSQALAPRLKNRRILYVGGRPSSTPAIRDLVVRSGGEFQKHDGGLEDRKGLLEASVAWAQFVLFPVDCIDHDSVGRLKRLCTKLGTPFVPLRSSGVASFAAAISGIDDTRSMAADARSSNLCARHG